jgi:hypothetical protein
MIYPWEVVRFIALSPRVLAVAVVNTRIGDWSAFIEAVPGRKHEDEYMVVARIGTKLPFDVAKVLFSYEASKYKWRD